MHVELLFYLKAFFSHFVKFLDVYFTIKQSSPALLEGDFWRGHDLLNQLLITKLKVGQYCFLHFSVKYQCTILSWLVRVTY